MHVAGYMRDLAEIGDAVFVFELVLAVAWLVALTATAAAVFRRVTVR